MASCGWRGRGKRSAVPTSPGRSAPRNLRLASARAGLPCPVYFPTRALSTDNAVMIAAAAFPKLRRREFSGFDAPAQPNLALA